MNYNELIRKYFVYITRKLYIYIYNEIVERSIDSFSCVLFLKYQLLA